MCSEVCDGLRVPCGADCSHPPVRASLVHRYRPVGRTCLAGHRLLVGVPIVPVGAPGGNLGEER